MNLRAPDRKDPRGKLAGGIGTLVVHAGAALFLVSQVRTTTATPQERGGRRQVGAVGVRDPGRVPRSPS